MIITVNSMTVGLADAGSVARAMIVARAFGKGVTLPPFPLLRS